MTTSEVSLLDMNVLVYAADTNSPFHILSMALRERGLRGDLPLCVCPQVLNEFFAVVTDSKRVSHPRSQKEATLEVEKYFHSKRILKIYPDVETIKNTLVLLEQYQITRQAIFDLHLVATMLSNNVTRLYTFNQDHFTKYNEIETLTP